MNSSTADRIAELVRQVLAKRGLDRAVDHDANLNDAGLSSLDTVNLMLAVEAEFAVKIPDRDMTPANFRSVGGIHALVDRLLTSRADAPAL
jgi:acyl carrier protein